MGKYNSKFLFTGKNLLGVNMMKFPIISPIAKQAYTKQVVLQIKRDRSVNGVKQHSI